MAERTAWTMDRIRFSTAALIVLVLTTSLFGFNGQPISVKDTVPNVVADRFTDNENGTVTDNVTKLVWLKQADCFPYKNWEDARKAAALLSGGYGGSGQCGLADNSKAGDWHMPSKAEWEGFLFANKSSSCNPAVRAKDGSACCLPSNCAFTGVPRPGYQQNFWSDSETSDPQRVYIAHLDNGTVTSDPKYTPLKTEARGIWLVRGSHDESPLSAADMSAVMNWIAVQVAAEELPVCWRDSDTQVGEVAGRVADCDAGFTNNGATCGRGADTKLAPSQLATCPAGFTNTGVTCYRKAGSKDKRGSWCTGGCDEGYTDMGCFCLRPAWSRKLTEAGTCPKGMKVSSADGRCIVDCVAKYGSGYENTGETCFRPAYTKDKGAMHCNANERLGGVRCYPKDSDCGSGRENISGLCYDKCKPGYYRDALTCWQSCPSQQSVNCGAACATDTKECAEATVSMVLSPLVLAGNLATGGLAGNATKFPRAAAAFSKMHEAYEKIEPLLKAKEVYENLHAHYEFYSRQYADNFDELTSHEIARAIDEKFGPVGARYVKEQWGYRHLAMMMNADGFTNMLNTLNTAALFDSTGVVSVITAFAKPVCSPNSVFPTVRRLYVH